MLSMSWGIGEPAGGVRKLSSMGLLPQHNWMWYRDRLAASPCLLYIVYTLAGCIPSWRGGRPCFVFMFLWHSYCAKLFSVNLRLCPQCWVQSGNRTVAWEVCPLMVCGILAAWQREVPERCSPADLGLTPCFSAATHLTLSVFLNLDELQFLRM